MPRRHAALRAAAFAGVTVPVAVAGHVLGAGPVGEQPDAAGLLLAPWVAFLVHRCWLGRARRSLPVLWGTLAALQCLLHLVLTATRLPVPHHAAAHAAAGAAGGPDAATAMLLGHLVALLVLGPVVQRVEEAVHPIDLTRAALAAPWPWWGAAVRRVLASCAGRRRVRPADVGRLVRAVRWAPVVAGRPAGHRQWLPSGLAGWRAPPVGRPQPVG